MSATRRITNLTISVSLLFGAAFTAHPSAAGAAPQAEAPTAAAIVPLTPARLLDTRSGLGAPAGPLGPQGQLDLAVTGVGGVPANGVGAVVLTVTATEPTDPSYVTVWPTGESRPTASSVNMLPGDTVPNLVIAKVGAGGQVSLFNGFGTTHLVADVMAWIPAGIAYGALTPERLLDTRSGVGAPAGPVGPGGVVELTVANQGGVPGTGAGAVVLNVTATEPSAASFVTVWPTGEPQPGTSSLNMQAGRTVPNLVVSKIGADGKVSLGNRFGTTHLVADVVGWLPTTGGYSGITPSRVLDTRLEGGALGAGDTRIVDLADDVPGDATTVALSVTITEPTANTYITAWPADVDRPGTSNLNALAGVTRAVAVTVKLSADQRVALFNPFGAAHVVVDLVGWYGTPTDAPMAFGIDTSLQPSQPELEPGRPLAVMASNGITTELVADELLVSGPLADAEAIAAAWHGTIVESLPGGDGFEPTHLLAFDLAAIDPAALPDPSVAFAALEEGGAHVMVSDQTALTLIALYAQLTTDGYLVALNPLSDNDSYADGNIPEEVFDADRSNTAVGESNNAYEFEYLREGGGMDHGFTSAWTELDSYGRLRPAAKIAVFDGGYFDSNDQAPITLVGTQYNTENVASCGGSACPWHGTGVVDTIFATHANNIGTAGGATPAVTELVAVGVGRDKWSIINGLIDLTASLAGVGPLNGSEVLNISGGFSLPFPFDKAAGLILDPVIAAIHAFGLQIVAAAGNEGANVDGEDCFIVCWENRGYMPCENWTVVCVGGLKLGTTTHDPGSNYGHEDVDIWASYTVKVGPAPDQGGFDGRQGLKNRTKNGTSFSSPLVTAAAALVIAANPGLNGTSAVDRLLDNARPGTGRVNRILDVQAAVHDTLASQQPFVELTFPRAGMTLPYAGEVTLVAKPCCNQTPTSWEWREGPRNGTLAPIANSANPTLRLTGGVGARTLEVRATFPGGAVRTDRVDYTMTNQVPVVTMLRPLAGEQFFQSAQIPLRASTFDSSWGSPMPDGFVTWRVDGNIVATGNLTSTTGLSLGVHTVQVTVTDGNLSAQASRQITVVADPPDPIPSVEITSPGSHNSGTNHEDPPGTFSYRFTATATSSDTAPDPTSPTINWFRRPVGTATETFLGSGTSIQVILPWAPPGNPCDTGGGAYDVIARVFDGTTTMEDFITVGLTLVC